MSYENCIVSFQQIYKSSALERYLEPNWKGANDWVCHYLLGIDFRIYPCVSRCLRGQRKVFVQRTARKIGGISCMSFNFKEDIKYENAG